MAKKFYKTVIEITIITEGRYDPTSLEGINYDITDGEAVGSWNMESSKAITKKQMAEEMHNLGSDPEFFGEEYKEK
jgi:predicted HAD superfamily hydrolase